LPTASPHPCGSPGCPALVPRGKPRCDEHSLVYERRRGSAHERGYDARWRAYRLRYLREHPLCVLCAAEGRTEAATVVDHIRAHKGDQGLFWQPSNHRASCKAHHDARVDEGDFGR
jgi:5-methylcytosine-specific restriction enzyme A